MYFLQKNGSITRCRAYNLHDAKLNGVEENTI